MTMTPTNWAALRDARTAKAREFVADLAEARQNPRLRAEMQRGLGRDYTEMHALVPLVAPHASGAAARRHYAVATYVGAFGTGRTGDSLGHALRRASNRPGVSGASLRTQLIALSGTAEEDAFTDRIPLLLRRLKSVDAVPDMAILLDDLRHWNYRSDKILHRWIEDSILGHPGTGSGSGS